MSDLNKAIDNKNKPILNSEQKELFFQETYADKKLPKWEIKTITSVFKGFEPYEKQNHCDLLLLDDDIIIDVMGSFNVPSPSTIRRYWAPLSKYEKWCSAKGFPVTGNIKRARKKNPYPGLKVIASPVQLATMLDDFFEPINENTIGNLTRMITWCIYSGVPMEAIEKLEKKDLDFENKKIKTPNGSYELYEESIPVFRNVCRLKEYNIEKRSVSPHKESTQKVPRPQKYVATYPDCYTAGLRASYNNRMKLMRERNNKDRYYLSNSMVSENGKFYRIYVYELMGFPVEFQNLTEFGGDDGGENKSIIKQEAIHNYKIWRKAAHPEYREYEP